EAGLDLTARVRNTGTRPGREVIQVYVEPPGTEPSRPVRTLAGFGAAEAGPGEVAEVTITLPARASGRCAEAGRGWIWPHRDGVAGIGRSSRELPLSVPVRDIPDGR